MLHVGRAAEGQRALDRRLGPRPTGHEERVVRELRTFGCDHPALLRVDGDCLPQSEQGVGSGEQRTEVVAPQLPRGERCGDGERPVEELRLGRQDLDADALAREGVERERGLEGGNAAADDYHPQLLFGHEGSDLGALYCTVRTSQ